MATARSLGGSLTELGVLISAPLRYPTRRDLSLRRFDAVNRIATTATLSEPAARMLNPAAFAGDTLPLCLLGGASCGGAGITYIGGCEPERTGGSSGSAGGGTWLGGSRGGGEVAGVGEDPGIGGMVKWLPFRLQRIQRQRFSVSQTETGNEVN
jgi:hypothetical protein